MSTLEYITSNQPTPKDLDKVPIKVLTYIKALEKALVENVMSTL